MKGEIFNLNGSHLLLDCLGCDKDKVSDELIIKDFLNHITEILGMKRLIDPVVVNCENTNPKWDRGGISAFVMIAESHISVHTFPQAGLLTADVYSCKPFDVEETVTVFKRVFNPSEIKQKIIKRELQSLRELELARLSHEN